MINELIKNNIITESARTQLEAYVNLFQQYNTHTNLSSIRQADDIWQKHIVDSLMLLQFESLQGSMMDIGTGGGVPGIPLAIARSELNVCLLDSVGKKVKACEYFVAELGLKNAHTLQARAEQLGQEKKYKHAYDSVLARATAYLPTILTWAAQLAKPNGKIILYKTSSADELADGALVASRLGLKLANQHVYQLDDQERQLLVYTKK